MNRKLLYCLSVTISLLCFAQTADAGRLRERIQERRAARIEQREARAAFPILRRIIEWWRERINPTPPVPPDPIPPDPVPPDPIPPIPPDPIPPVPPPPDVKGLNVLIVGPSPRAVRDLTPNQAAILTSRTVRDWLDVACEKLEDGTTAYRLVSRTSPPGLLSPRWTALIAKAPAEGVHVVATRPVEGAEPAVLVMPLPADHTELLKALSDFADVKPVVAKAPVANPREPTDAEWKVINPPNKVAIVDGKQRFLAAKPRDLKRQPYGSMGKSLAELGVRVIPRAEWPARLAALKKANAGLMPLTYGKVLSLDQGATSLCWANCVVGSCSTLMHVQGRGSYLLSAASVAGPINGYRNQGGWPSDAVQYVQAHGSVRQSLWPNTAISSSYAKKPEVIADYPKHQLRGSIADLGGTGKIFDECATVVMCGAPVAISLSWWGHAVEMVGVDYKDGTWYADCKNSWGAEFGDQGYFLLPEGRGSNHCGPDDAQALIEILAQ